MTPKYQAGRTYWDSQRIQYLRRHLRLTQSQLAAKMGTRQQTISEWETAMYQPRGTSATLLSVIAEQASFKYEASPAENKEKA